jgi:transcriptional regulator with XRE-family HTH domain
MSGHPPPNPVFTTEYQQIRDVLVAARLASGLSQKEVAQRIGRSASHVTLIESGQRRVDLLEFCTLAKALGIDAGAAVHEMSERIDRVRATSGSGAPSDGAR